MDTLQDVINNGGGTYNADGTIPDIKEGYYIGGVDCTIIPIENILKQSLTIKSFIQERLPNIGKYHYPAKTEDNYKYAGFWVDDGKLYIERVMHTYNKSYAIQTAQANKQLAIWSIHEEREVKV